MKLNTPLCFANFCNLLCLSMIKVQFYNVFWNFFLKLCSKEDFYFYKNLVSYIHTFLAFKWNSSTSFMFCQILQFKVLIILRNFRYILKGFIIFTHFFSKIHTILDIHCNFVLLFNPIPTEGGLLGPEQPKTV